MYRFPMGVLALTALIACNGDTGETDTSTECENQVISFFPADGATDAYYRTTVEVEFDDEEEDATFTVAAGATEVAGTYAWVEEKLVFTPTNPLSPSTDYTVTVSYSCSSDGSLTAEWRTSAVGAAVTGNLEGRSYLLDLTSGRFVQPEGVGDIIGEYLDQIVLIGVSDVDDVADEIDMLGALGVQDTTAPIEGAHTVDDSIDGISQDSCLPSIAFPENIDFAGNPYFKAGPADTTLSVAGFTVTVEDLAISGAFSPDADFIAGATLSGKIDTRPLVPLLDSDPAPCNEEFYNDGSNPNADNPAFPCEPDMICTLAASLFVECEPCAEGSTATTCGAEDTANDACCLSLLVDSITASELVVGTNDDPFAITEYSELGSDDPLTDPCIVNVDECSSEPDCQ